jgi:hypothetical protein
VLSDPLIPGTGVEAQSAVAAYGPPATAAVKTGTPPGGYAVRAVAAVSVRPAPSVMTRSKVQSVLAVVPAVSISAPTPAVTEALKPV